MLSLNLRSGDYITIGEDIVVQVYQTGASFRVAIEAPREMPIARGKLHEIENERPECIQKVWRKPRTKGFKQPVAAE